MQNVRITLNVKEATQIAKSADEGACGSCGQMVPAEVGLPFGVFGKTGGGGSVRWELVKAINKDDWRQAQNYFTVLVNESLDDMMANSRDDGQPMDAPTALELFKVFLFENGPEWLSIQPNIGWARS